MLNLGDDNILAGISWQSLTKHQQLWCRADTPSHEWVYSTSFVCQEALSLPDPDVKFSCQGQTITLTHARAHTHTHTHTHTQKTYQTDLIAILRWDILCIRDVSCSPSDWSGTNLIESMTVPRLLMESRFILTCDDRRETREEEEKTKEEKEGTQKCGSSKRLRLHKTLVYIHSVSSSPFSSPRHKRLLLVFLIFHKAAQSAATPTNKQVYTQASMFFW